MKVYVSRVIRRGPWGGGNRWLLAIFDALQRLQIEVVSSPRQADAIIVAGVEDVSELELGAVTLCQYAKQAKKPVLFRINDCDARKNTKHINQAIHAASLLATKIIYVSNWLKNHLDPFNTFDSKSAVIVNGVDHSIFKPAEKQSSQMFRIVTHHWSDNRLKGASWYEFIDRMTLSDNSIAFTFIGRHKCAFIGNTSVIPPCDGQALATLLAQQDLYVSGSVYDPGPNHIIEAVSCGLPVIASADGGACVEFSDGIHIAKDESQLKSLINNKQFHVASRKFSSWEFCADQYVTEIQNLCHNIDSQNL